VIRQLMQSISIVFHPLMMPTFAFLIINAILPDLISPLGWIMLPFLFITTFLIPIFGVSILKYSGTISSLTLEKREERFLPFLFVTIFYTITTVMFVLKIEVNGTVSLMLMATTLLIFILMLVSFFYKISIHAAGMSGVAGFLTVLTINHPESQMIAALLVCIILSGIVMSARLYLNLHTPNEILMGSAIGIAICFGAMYFFG
jgi:membrane-associated phospholipid phosphatase